MTSADSLKEAVAAATLRFAEKDLTWGRDAGDISLLDRETGHVYILPMPSAGLPIPDWSVIKPKDVVTVDLDGKPVEPSALQPTVELLTHLRVYQNRPDVGAIVHSHGKWTRVFAALRKPLPALMMDQFKYTGASRIGCAKLGPAGSDVVAMSAVECLGPYGKVVLLAAHGAVCVGRDLDEALSVAEIAEDMARLAILAEALGGAPEVALSDFIDEDTARSYLKRREL